MQVWPCVFILAATSGICSASIQYTPVQDVGVRFSSRAPSDELRVRNNDTDTAWAKSYIQFDVADLVDTATGATVTLHQFLELNYVASSANLNLFAFTTNQDSFDQTTISWASAPGNDVASGGAVDPLSCTLVSTIPYDLGTDGYRPDGYNWEFGLNSNGLDIINSDTDRIITFVLTMDAPGSTFSAYADPRTSLADPLPPGTPVGYLPTLNVAIPEPTVIGGILSASLGLLLRKRK